MSVIAQIAVVLSGLVHVLIFAMESVLFTRVQVYRRFRTNAGDVAAVRPWAFNQGWYNLFLAAGAIGGTIAVHAGNATAGRSIALFCAGDQLLKGAALNAVQIAEQWVPRRAAG